jgi:AraC-like DNA-binding protein
VGRSSITSCHAGNHAAVEIQLSALAADLVLGVPAGELADRVVDLTDLWGRTGELLAEQLTEPGAAGGAGGGWQSRFSLVEGVLLDRARRAGTTTAPDPRLLLAHRMIHQRGGDLSMGSLLEATGWSRRRLATEFRRHVGLTPKALARLVRFRRAESMLRASRHRSLASVALTCGYYDQAHLNREFRELAGCPPTAYLARLRADVAAAEMGACAPGAVTDVQDGAAGPS